MIIRTLLAAETDPEYALGVAGDARLTWLVLRVTVPRTLMMPPPPSALESCGPRVCWLPVTALLFRVSLATLDGSKVALAIPPPASVAVLPVTWL